MQTILVVDDHLDIRELLAHMLALGGYRTVVAPNGEAALAVLNDMAVVLVLMDLSMPGLDGWAATARIKADPKTAGIPVLAVTGRVTEDDLSQAIEAGCDDVITKPLDLDVLMAKVAGLIAQAAVVSAAHDPVCPVVMPDP